MNKAIQWIINITAGIFFFFFFLLISFPFENLMQNALSQVERQTSGRYRITVSSIDPNVIFPSVFKDFQVHQKEGAKDRVIVDFKEVKLGVSYLPLLASRLSASFSAEGKSGSVKGDIDLHQSSSSFSAKLNKLKISDVPYVQSILAGAQIPLDGAFSGEMEGSFFQGQPVKNEAFADLKIENLVIPAGRLTKLQFDAPEALSLAGKDKGKFKLKMEKGRIDLQEFSLPGEDLILNLSGNLVLNPRVPFSRLNVQGGIQFSPKMEGVLGSVLIVIAKEKTAEGVYPISVNGRLNKPEIKIGNFSLSSLQPSEIPSD